MIIEPVNPPLVLEPSIPVSIPVEVAAFIKGTPGNKGDPGDQGPPAALEYADHAALPVTGAVDTLYLLTTPYTSGGLTSSLFRWNGSAYVAINAAPASSDAITEGSTHLFLNPAERVKIDNLAPDEYTLNVWAYGQTFRLVSATRDANGAIVVAAIVWPDGVTGQFVTDVASVDFPGAIDAWHATYLGTVNKTITQPAVTRDANGAVTAQPAITIV